MRTSRTAAEALAVDSVRYRTLAFVVSGCLASGAGVLLGTLIQSSRSNQFTLFASIQYLAVTFIGGIGSVLGAALAGALQVLPTELVRPLVEGRDSDAHVAEALQGLRGHVEALRVLGSYPAG